MTEPKSPEPGKTPPAGPPGKPTVDPRIRAAQLSAAAKPKGLPPRPDAGKQDKPATAAPATEKPAAKMPMAGASPTSRQAMVSPAPTPKGVLLPRTKTPSVPTMDPSGQAAAKKPAEPKLDENGFPLDPLSGMDEETRFQQFVIGNITLAQMKNISHEQLYSLAELGNNFYKQGQYEKARAIFEGLVVMDPGDSWLHLCLGLCFAQLGNDYRALLELDRAIFLHEYSIQPRLERAEILMKYGELQLAIQDLAKAIELDTNGDDPYALRARVLLDVLRQMVSGPEPATAK